MAPHATVESLSMLRLSAAFRGLGLGLGLTIAGALAGCTLGISEGQSPHTSFTADVNYHRALHTADRQARDCLRGEGAYSVITTEDAASHSGLVRVVAPLFSNDVARVVIKGDGDSRSNVDVTMWGRNIWDKTALDAMRDAIRYSATSCTSYMPGEKVQR
jgi:hypothetical protein